MENNNISKIIHNSGKNWRNTVCLAISFTVHNMSPFDISKKEGKNIY